MPAISLADAQTREDPAIAWRWRVELPLDVAGNESFANTIAIYAEQADVSHTFIDTAPSYVQATMRNYPKSFGIDPFDVTFYEDKHYSVLNFMINWQLKIIDRQGNFGLKKDYAKRISFFFQDYQGNENFQMSYLNCYPIRKQSYTFNSEGSERIRTQVSFMCDQGGRWNGNDQSSNNSSISPID